MQIDRSNYEIWLIDWLDGNLSESQVAKLKLFLQDNPELKEEYEDLATFRLNASEESFQHKNNLKRSISSLPESQFEYLCIGFLEKDLSPVQQAELKEIIDRDPDKKMAFELIQKTRLSPPEIRFRQKNSLLRKTAGQKIIRLSVFGLSAAAIIALVVINYISIPKTLQVKSGKTTLSVISDSAFHEPAAIKVPEKQVSEKTKIPKRKQSRNFLAVLNQPTIPLTESGLNHSSQTDSIPASADTVRTLINKIPVTLAIGLKTEPVPGSLIALNSTVVLPEYDDGRSRLSKFIAKTFREKILKENTGKDSPLKAYEIAEAGVSGLNKLLGWEMALDERKDENGELKSVYFSSKILKFNAPVKKSEPLQ
jgi:hypothetical protein